MSHAAGERNRTVPEFWRGKPEEHSRKLAQSVNSMLDGQTNNQFTVTLEAGQTQTEVEFLTARPGVSVLLTAQNAAAATLQRTTDVYAEADTGKVRIKHDVSVSGTERFSLIIVG